MSDQPPKLAFDLERDLRILSIMASSLTPYLYEKELFGYLSGSLPKLTIGGLLLRLHRLSALENQLDHGQHISVQDARLNFEAERSGWAVHYEAKLAQELQTRIDTYSQFVIECQDDKARCAADYPSQAEKRTIIEHLFVEAEERDCLPEDAQPRLKHADDRLRQMLENGDFISEDILKSVYPRDHFWWMYGFIADEDR
ncbi:MAG: hypothetical protein JW966_00240 [Anaerolineae bacterium]|nr:hypothetical protein [Anaerolineae bacterium]